MKKTLLFLIFSAIFSQSFSQTLPTYVPGNNLLAWYPFSGNAVDSSGGGHNGTVYGALLTSDRHGNANSAYLFDGSSTKISTTLLPPTGNAARTISCWFRYNSLPNICGDYGACIVGYGGTTSLCSQANRNFSLELAYYPPLVRVDGICAATSQTVDSVDTSWHFFAAIYDTSYGDFRNIKLYVDGVYKTTTYAFFGGITDVITDTLSKMEIGKGHYSCQRFFDGKIDDIGVWDRALAESELYGLYLGPPIAAGDSFLAYSKDICSGQKFTILQPNYSSSLHVVTSFGDGTNQNDTFASSGISVFNHNYPNTGIYTVKHVLYRGVTAVDSVSYSCSYQTCTVLPVRLYHDADANCVFGATEVSIYQPSVIEIDSSGIVLDTVSVTSGLDYYAYGPAGSIYSFKLLSTIQGLTISCPGSGILADTVGSGLTTKYFGFSCSTDPGYDLQLFTSFRAGHHHMGGLILASNTRCTPPAATVTMHLNPKFNSMFSSIPAASSMSGNVVTWDINTLSSVISSPFLIYPEMEGSASIGDTVMTSFIIDPISGDANSSDNIVIRVDTVKSGYDPNDIVAEPSCLTPGTTKLTYVIHFENTGNDTAFNIYILDTLSASLNPSTLRVLAASAAMNTSIIEAGGHTIAKFDFPHINLLDSSHHGLCEGMVVYSIEVKNGLADGTVIPSRAGIYFDDNQVVLTNTAESTVGCPVASVAEVGIKPFIGIAPNPATNQITISQSTNIPNGADVQFSQFTITNSIGQEIMQQSLTGLQTKVNVSKLVPGLYYITFRGKNGIKTEKFIRM